MVNKGGIVVAGKPSGVSHEGHRQRMKERFLSGGLDGFSSHEVLEMLLFYAIPYRDTNGLGHTLSDTLGGLVNVLDANYTDLVKLPGVTPHVATLITLCGSIARRYQREQYGRVQQLLNTEELCRFIMPWFIGEKEESVLLVSMDNKRKLLNTTRIFQGSVNAAELNVRVAVQQALRDNATQVVIAHNHPSGFAIPSRADVETTVHFAKVLSMVDVRLLDHIIVAEGDCVSMADSREMSPLFGGTVSPNAAVADRR